PATAKHAVQRDAIGLFGQARGDQRLLRAVQRALGVELRQVAVEAGVEARARQPLATGGGSDQVLLRGNLLRQRLPAQPRLGNFAEAGLDGLLVLRKRDVAIGRGHAQRRAQPATLEDRQVDARNEAPKLRAAIEQPRQFVAGRTDASGQRDRRKERRACRAYI